jgi:peptidoglycan/xylan/chitin deacetylase (PgdA/CDA1 family)
MTVPRLTLTFDNGPEPGVTEAVLDVLAARRLRATFFPIGRKLTDPAARALAERARSEGHWIGNHTWSHGDPLGRRCGEAGLREVALAQAAIGPLAHPDLLFRPNGGGGALGPHLLSGAVAAALMSGGFTCVLWNAVPRDWIEPDAWAARALAALAAQPWTVLVLHDLPTGAMRHLSGFLDAAAKAGVAFRQDFPDACVPLRRGREAVPGALSPYVSSHAEQRDGGRPCSRT